LVSIEDPPEYTAENAKNPKEDSDWLEGPRTETKPQTKTLLPIPGAASTASNPAAVAAVAMAEMAK
jgi:hypothetical protein